MAGRRGWREDGVEKMVKRTWWKEDCGAKIVGRRWWGEYGGEDGGDILGEELWAGDRWPGRNWQSTD